MPPSILGYLRVSQITERSAVLAWEPSTDSASLCGYSLRVDGFDIGGTQDMRFAVAGLSPGKTYTLSVQAFDKEFNLAESQIKATTTCVDGGTILLGWDIQSGTTMTWESGRQIKKVMVLSEHAAEVDSVVMMAMEAGLDDATTGWGSCAFQGVNKGAKLLTDAVAKKCYFTFAPAPQGDAETDCPAIANSRRRRRNHTIGDDELCHRFRRRQETK